MDFTCPQCNITLGNLGELVAHMRTHHTTPNTKETTMTASLPVCPRCNNYIPNNEMPGKYPGAISRLDNETEICSSCGVEEAIMDFSGELTDWRK